VVGGTDVGEVGLVVGAVEGALGLGVGKLGSVGPAPGPAIGLPSTTELHEAVSAMLASNAPLARRRRAPCDNAVTRTRHSPETSPETSGASTQDYASSDASDCSDAVLELR